MVRALFHGDLVPLGDHGDCEAADATATFRST